MKTEHRKASRSVRQQRTPAMTSRGSASTQRTTHSSTFRSTWAHTMHINGSRFKELITILLLLFYYYFFYFLATFIPFSTNSERFTWLIRWRLVLECMTSLRYDLQVSFNQVVVANRMHLMGGLTTSCHVTSFLLLQSNTSAVWRVYQETDGVDKVSCCINFS